MLNSVAKLDKEAKVWVKRNSGQNEVIEIVPDLDYGLTNLCYQLYIAFEQQPNNIGRILFDADGYWIYDGNTLSVVEQEQVARFIINYVETF